MSIASPRQTAPLATEQDSDYVEPSYCEFERAEMRRTTIRRYLACGCVIDPGELYSYFVAKVRDVDELVQVELCRYCTTAYQPPTVRV